MRRPKTALQSCRISRFRFDDLAVVVIVIEACLQWGLIALVMVLSFVFSPAGDGR